MSGLKVVSFDARAERKQEVVELAMEILKRAEAGEFSDLTYAGSMVDGAITSGFTSTEDAPRRLAAVSRLQHRLHRMMDEVGYGD